MGKGAQADPDLHAGAALNQSVSQATQPSDELIRKACDGDASALEELVRAVYPLVLRWARVAIGDEDDAQDLAHEVLVRVLRTLGSYRGEARFTTWLYRIVRNAALDRETKGRRRREREMKVALLTPWDSSGPDPAADLDHSELRRAVMRHFAELPPRQREVFDMCELRGLSSTEVGNELGISPSTVRVNLLKARRSLRKGLLELSPTQEPV